MCGTTLCGDRIRRELRAEQRRLERAALDAKALAARQKVDEMLQLLGINEEGSADELASGNINVIGKVNMSDYGTRSEYEAAMWEKRRLMQSVIEMSQDLKNKAARERAAETAGTGLASVYN